MNRLLKSIVSLLSVWLFPTVANADLLRVETLHFPAGSQTIQVTEQLTGYEYVDYQLSGSAGQRLLVSLQASNLANYFNLLPPQSTDVAMFVGAMGGNSFAGILPDEGTYTLRVYLMRSAARRQETSDYRLDVTLEGVGLQPLPGSEDALVPGSRFHAMGDINCKPGFSEIQRCSAGVVRRDRNGTASIEISWGEYGKRRLLFIEAQLVATDAAQEWKLERNSRGDLRVNFGDDEYYEIPEVFLTGG